MLADSLARTLQAHDVKLKIKPQVLSKLQQVDTILLVEHHSPPLQEIIASLLDRSDNMFTEGLLRAIAHQQGRRATASQGVTVVDSLWRASGLDTSPLFQRDGSGLARANKCSARFLTEMLNYMASHPCEGTTLSQLMPTAGRRIGPLLENHGMERDLVVKSGSMTGVQCFVGYYPASILVGCAYQRLEWQSNSLERPHLNLAHRIVWVTKKCPKLVVVIKNAKNRGAFEVQIKLFLMFALLY